MVSLKKQKGFTLVELLIVIIIIGILATLVIVTFTGVQAKARDSQRQTDIGAVDSHLEAFFAEKGYYPSYADLTSAAFLSANLKGLDPQSLIDPKSADSSQTTLTDAMLAADIVNGTTPTGTQYAYSAKEADGTTDCTAGDTGCVSFKVTALLESNGQTYQKKSNS